MRRNTCDSPSARGLPHRPPHPHSPSASPTRIPHPHPAQIARRLRLAAMLGGSAWWPCLVALLGGHAWSVMLGRSCLVGGSAWRICLTFLPTTHALRCLRCGPCTGPAEQVLTGWQLKSRQESTTYPGTGNIHTYWYEYRCCALAVRADEKPGERYVIVNGEEKMTPNIRKTGDSDFSPG